MKRFLTCSLLSGFVLTAGLACESPKPPAKKDDKKAADTKSTDHKADEKKADPKPEEPKVKTGETENKKS